MKEKPILFSTPMVKAIEDNRKTMTRRTSGLEKVNEKPNEFKIVGISLLYNGAFKSYNYSMDIIFDFMNKKGDIIKCKPRYQKGDKLWVKETFTIIHKNIICYKADTAYPKTIKWKSSLFMRKEYTRIWLECTEVRCERLQDISEQDALAEGIEKIEKGTPHEGYKDYYIKGLTIGVKPIDSFFSLWLQINGLESMQSNPWVFVYEFKTNKPKII